MRADAALLLPHALTDDPAWVDHVPVTEDRLRSASFLDGREPIACGPAVAVRLPDGSRADPLPATIAHVAFCGSTLLSRMIDVPGRTLVLREPAIQIELSDRLARGCAPNDLIVGCHLRLAGLAPSLSTVVKPTSWANPLLPRLAGRPHWSAVFLTMAPRSFLRAVFRGGRDRIAYAVRSAQHFAPFVPTGAERLATAAAPLDDPLLRAARLILLMLWLELQLFRQCSEAMGSRSLEITFAELMADPVEQAIRASGHLGLPLTRAQIASQHETNRTRHAKGGRAYDKAQEAIADQEVERFHARRFDRALEWLDPTAQTA